MSAERFEDLVLYQTSRWGEAVSERWFSLCACLRDYQPPCRTLKIEKERKWELVSAFQKAIRRGDKTLALRLVSAMDSLSAEYAYFWRRLCVTACEDIGPADDTFAAFVVACSTVFPPKTIPDRNYDLICFLAQQMCDLSNRSRIYCSCAVIEPAASKSELPEMGTEDELIVSTIMQRKAAVLAPSCP